MEVLHPPGCCTAWRCIKRRGTRPGKAGSQRLRKGAGAPYSPDLVGAKIRPGRRGAAPTGLPTLTLSPLNVVNICLGVFKLAPDRSRYVL
jgi:hypothetical protein